MAIEARAAADVEAGAKLKREREVHTAAAAEAVMHNAAAAAEAERLNSAAVAEAKRRADANVAEARRRAAANAAAAERRSAGAASEAARRAETESAELTAQLVRASEDKAALQRTVAGLEFDLQRTYFRCYSEPSEGKDNVDADKGKTFGLSRARLLHGSADSGPC
jgi:hypothetical protein